MESFGELLKLCRNRCWDADRERSLTQERLAELLSIESGVESYSGSTVSNWERGLNQIRRDDRHVLVALIKVMHQGGGMQNPEAANKLLIAGNYRPLNDDEVRVVNPDWNQASLKPSAPLLPSADEQQALLPAPSYSRLFGVEDVIQNIIDQLKSSHSRFIILTGISGMGKTAVAHAVARQAIQQNLFAQVVWVSAEVGSAKAPFEIDIINRLCQRLLPEEEYKTHWANQLMRLRFKLHDQPHLIVIDDLGNFAGMSPLLDQLLGIIGPGKCLLTAYQLPPVEIEATIISIPELLFKDAKALLNHQSTIIGAPEFHKAKEEDLKDLYGVVGGHPLALRLIPRLARMYSLPEILRGWQRVQPGRIADVYQSVYDDLWHTLLPAEKQLMRMMPLGSQTGVTLAYLQAICDLPQDQLWSSLTKLMECCLVEPQGNLYERRYGTHRLTVQYVLGRSNAAESISFPPVTLIESALAFWQQYLAQLSDKEWHLLDKEQDNLALALQFSLTLSDEEITPLIRTAWQNMFGYLFRYCEQRGYAAIWLLLLEEVTENFVGHPSIQCHFLNRLGVLHRLNHQLPEALEMHHHVLQIALQAEEAIEIAQSHLNLGNDYLLNRQYEKAVEHGTLALDQYDKLGLIRRERSATLNLLGTAARRQGHLERSGRYLQEAAAIWRDLKHWPELARTLHNLALVLHAQNNIDGAEKCLGEAKRILTKTASELDRTLIYLAEGAFHFQHKKYHRAETVFKQIDLTYLEDSGQTYYLASALNNLGNTAFKQERFDEAEQLLRQSIQHWQKLAEPLEMANSLGKLGDVLVRKRKKDKARSSYWQALDLLEMYDINGLMSSLKQELKEDLERVENMIREG